MTLTRSARERWSVLSTCRQLGISTVLALCLLMILLAACQSALQPPDLVGVWTDRDRLTYMQFDSDGTWMIAETYERLSASSTALNFGPYHLEGRLLTIETNEESGYCRSAAATYEVELSEQEELIFTLVDDPCAGRGQDLTRGPFERYSP